HHSRSEGKEFAAAIPPGHHGRILNPSMFAARHVSAVLVCVLPLAAQSGFAPEHVTFPSCTLQLSGQLWRLRCKSCSSSCSVVDERGERPVDTVFQRKQISCFCFETTICTRAG